MRNSLFYIGFLSLLASLLTACSQSETVTTYEKEVVKQQTVSPVSTPVPISFSTYVPEYATTRGAVDNLNDLAREGFTVFAYHTGTSSFADAVSAGTAIPNLMYNQLVTGTVSGNSVTWQYTPMKYWPNNNDKVSFFAYGTHANVTQNADNTKEATALSSGIINISGNRYNGVPYLIYQLGNNATMDDMRDLLVATPVYNQTKQNISESISFNFTHALTALGFRVTAVYNGGSVQSIDNIIGSDCFIRIEEIKMVAPISTKEGKLLLDGTWERLNTNNEQTATFIINASNMGDNLKYERITSQAVANRMKTQGVGRSDTSPYDADTSLKSVKDAAGADLLFYFFPFNENDVEFIVTVKYHILMLDPRAKYGLSDIPMTVTGTATKDLTNDKGHVLWFNLQLGGELDPIQITVDETQSNRFWNNNNNGESTNNYTP